MFLLFFTSFFCIFYWFHKKLYVLLIFEVILVSMIFGVFTFFGSDFSSSFSLLILSIMMVLDSVLGICILISCGRSSSYIYSSFNFF